MNETEFIAKENMKIIPQMFKDIKRIGLERGDCVIVHSSFKSLGLKNYSPSDVIYTFLEVLGETGTLIMPTFTYSFSGATKYQPFNRENSPSLCGIITETFRKYTGVIRNEQPTHSVAAIGKYAEMLTKDKELKSAIGNGSSFHDAYNINAKILLLGVGNNRNTMLHYAEVAAESPYKDLHFDESWGRTAHVEKDGCTIEIPIIDEIPGCSRNFGIVDTYLENRKILKRYKICSADSFIMDSKKMVDAIIEKLKSSPEWLLCDDTECKCCHERKKVFHNS